jgi:hypothetical protein
MVPSSDRITSGEPAFAQATAHSGLVGFLRFLVKAQAESRTYPFIVLYCALLPIVRSRERDGEKSK